MMRQYTVAACVFVLITGCADAAMRADGASSSIRERFQGRSDSALVQESEPQAIGAALGGWRFRTVPVPEDFRTASTVLLSPSGCQIAYDLQHGLGIEGAPLTVRLLSASGKYEGDLTAGRFNPDRCVLLAWGRSDHELYFTSASQADEAGKTRHIWEADPARRTFRQIEIPRVADRLNLQTLAFCRSRRDPVWCFGAAGGEVHSSAPAPLKEAIYGRSGGRGKWKKIAAGIDPIWSPSCKEIAAFSDSAKCWLIYSNTGHSSWRAVGSASLAFARKKYRSPLFGTSFAWIGTSGDYAILGGVRDSHGAPVGGLWYVSRRGKSLRFIPGVSRIFGAQDGRHLLIQTGIGSKASYCLFSR